MDVAGWSKQKNPTTDLAYGQMNSPAFIASTFSGTLFALNSLAKLRTVLQQQHEG
jgi:hypothetical protein